MLSDLSGDALNGKSLRLVEMAYESGGKAITYLSALQLMAEDLFEQHKMQDEQVRRLLLLQGNYAQHRADAVSYPGEGLAYIAAATFLAFLPFGSKMARDLSKFVLNRWTRPLASFTKIESLNLFRSAPAVDLGMGWRAALLRDYSLSFVLKQYFQYFGPFTMVYFYWFDWKESTRGHSIPTVSRGKSKAEFQKLLRELEKL